ncbi:MAG TPA: hypothetical protein VHK69_06580, partial [Chitinophagaceae bacterium]|nr:hypothetical protein [Chitinophagaceae bacterium]
MANGKSEIKEKLLAVAARLEHGFIQAKHAVKEKFHLMDPVMIQPYYGYGNETCVFLKGRVIEKEKIKEKKEGASTLRHLKNTYRRYESDEIPGIRVKATYAGREQEVVTDDEGFFEVEFRFNGPIDYEQAGDRIRLYLLETKTENDQK